jgi:hypothetical protein
MSLASRYVRGGTAATWPIWDGPARVPCYFAPMFCWNASVDKPPPNYVRRHRISGVKSSAAPAAFVFESVLRWLGSGLFLWTGSRFRRGAERMAA